MRRIAILTGKRGGFGALSRIMNLIEADPDLAFDLIVTDMHLNPIFGETVREVEKKFRVARRLDLGQTDDSGLARASALGRATTLIAEALHDLNPDILLTLGDRGEVLSACIAALEQNIPIAHILGGDVAGNRDGARIHAITKLAHLHFPSSKDAADRIIKLGEEPWRVHHVGATYVDAVVRKEYTPNAEACRRVGVGSDEKYCIVLHHPTTLQESRSYDEARAVLDAVKATGMRAVVVYPCSDQGYQGVIRAIEERRSDPQFVIHQNIEAEDFWGLEEGAEFMIGNSSAGLIETPYFGLPTVNVGQRQSGRMRDKNVIDAQPTVDDITRAIGHARDPSFRKRFVNHHIFGTGRASEAIVRVLKEAALDDTLLMKKMTY